jgi:hypothetical protein
MNTQLTYENVVKSLFLPDIEELVPDGECHSLPIVGSVKGIIVDCFFLYCIVVDNEETNEVHYIAPTSILKIDSVKNRLLYFDDSCAPKPVQAKEIDFSNDDKNERYESLYLEVRSFAFKDSLDENEIEVLENFIATLDELEDKSFLKSI